MVWGPLPSTARAGHCRPVTAMLLRMRSTRGRCACTRPGPRPRARPTCAKHSRKSCTCMPYCSYWCTYARDASIACARSCARAHAAGVKGGGVLGRPQKKRLWRPRPAARALHAHVVPAASRRPHKVHTLYRAPPRAPACTHAAPAHSHVHPHMPRLHVPDAHLHALHGADAALVVAEHCRGQRALCKGRVVAGHGQGVHGPPGKQAWVGKVCTHVHGACVRMRACAYTCVGLCCRAWHRACTAPQTTHHRQ